MEIKTDIQIAQENEMAHISQIAEKAGLAEEYVELYGNYKARSTTACYKTEKTGRTAR